MTKAILIMKCISRSNLLTFNINTESPSKSRSQHHSALRADWQPLPELVGWSDGEELPNRLGAGEVDIGALDGLPLPSAHRERQHGVGPLPA